MADQGAATAALRFSAGEAGVPADPDAWLLERSRQGDVQAFETLFRKYQGYVYNISVGMLGNGEDAADVTQETFLRIHRGLCRFRGESTFTTWLYRVAVNLCITELRRRSRRRFQVLEEVHQPYGECALHEEHGPSPDEAILREEDRRSVHAALNLLSPDYRAIMVLRHFQQLPYEEIAAVLGLTLSQVKTRLFRARRMFKDRYRAIAREPHVLRAD
ncbi:MAG: sigma-70 family RNA polymerase sigma factor [Armatimonadetes bacterium]|nr:sigma-70 family RNA polymerase sigma factor [Armatimonadota bacterium]